MRYHTPVTQHDDDGPVPIFMIHNDELVCPDKILLKNQYPSLPTDMVKVLGRDGQYILIPLRKLKTLSSMDA
jgi:hypothetical protein